MKPWTMTPARRAWYDRSGSVVAEKNGAHWASLTPTQRLAKISKQHKKNPNGPRPFPIQLNLGERTVLTEKAESVGLTLHQYILSKLGITRKEAE